MVEPPFTVIGPYRVGEIPEALALQFRDASGTALPTVGWSAAAEQHRWGDETVVDLTATVDNAGLVEVTMEAFTDAGDYELEVWIWTGTTAKLSSRHFRFLVQSAIKVPT